MEESGMAIVSRICHIVNCICTINFNAKGLAGNTCKAFLFFICFLLHYWFVHDFTFGCEYCAGSDPPVY